MKLMPARKRSYTEANGVTTPPDSLIQGNRYKRLTSSQRNRASPDIANSYINSYLQVKRGSNPFFFSLIARRQFPIGLLEWREAVTGQQKEQIMRMRAAGTSYGSIASALNISVNTVKSFCKRSPKGNPGKITAISAVDNTSCPQCGAHLMQTPGHRQKRFCSTKCRMAWWSAHPEEMKRTATSTVHCERCGAAFVQYGSRPRKFCSRMCYLAHRYDQGGDAHA